MPRTLLLVLALVLAALYSFLSPANPGTFAAPGLRATIRNERVLLLTAHPDDECLFFAPTVLTLRARGAAVHNLCLSVGDAEGLGEVRRSELNASLDILGIDAAHRVVVDHPSVAPL
jgi:N-acetylglucosaminylphosphatidylinositol deacetylase